MLGVEQIRTLEDRIEKALAFIGGLRAENAALQTKAEASDEARGRAEDRAAAAESRVRELEEAIAIFRRDQSRIEEGILHALEKLDAFEDLVLRGAPQPSLSTLSPSQEREAIVPSEAEPAEGSPVEPEEARIDEAPILAASASHEPPPAPQPEQTRMEPRHSEPERPVAPQSAPDELGIF